MTAHPDTHWETVDSLHGFSCNSDSYTAGNVIPAISADIIVFQAVFSSVMPGEYMSGHVQQMISFPQWLGRNSSANKNHRTLQQLLSHMALRLSDFLFIHSEQYLTMPVPPTLAGFTIDIVTVISTLCSVNVLGEDLSELKFTYTEHALAYPITALYSEWEAVPRSLPPPQSPRNVSANKLGWHEGHI